MLKCGVFTGVTGQLEGAIADDHVALGGDIVDFKGMKQGRKVQYPLIRVLVDSERNTQIVEFLFAKNLGLLLGEVGQSKFPERYRKIWRPI